MTQVEIAEKHGVTPSAISKWKSTLEEDGIEDCKAPTRRVIKAQTQNSTSRTESNSSSCSKKEHRLTAGKLISGQPPASLH
jgi:transposase-like protein